MKLSNLGLDPRFRRVDDLPAVLRVGAVRFPGAGVAGMGGRPILHDLAHGVTVVRMQMMPAGTFPDVQVPMIFEAGRAELSRTPMRVTAEQLQSGSRHDEEPGIPGTQYNLVMKWSDHGSRAAGWVISVNSVGPVSSRPARGTMCRKLSQER